MATEVITFEYLSLDDDLHDSLSPAYRGVNGNVYIKQDVVTETQAVDGYPARKMVWKRWAWSATNLPSSQWETYRWESFGLKNVL